MFACSFVCFVFGWRGGGSGDDPCPTPQVKPQIGKCWRCLPCLMESVGDIGCIGLLFDSEPLCQSEQKPLALLVLDALGHGDVM